MTWYGSVTCGACSKTTTVLVSDSCLGNGPLATDPYKRSQWADCPECGKHYCPEHKSEGACALCRDGADQPPAEPQGIVFSLDFSADECNALINVLNHVLGDTLRSQRRFCRSVMYKLNDLGFWGQFGNVVSGELRIENDRHLKHVLAPGIRPPRS